MISHGAPPIPPSIPPASSGSGRGRELDRILALPRRPPLDVSRNRITKLYTPEAEALADVETARYALAPNEAPAHDPTRQPGTCRCQELFHLPCIKRLFPSQAWYLRELRLYGGVLGMITVAGGKTLCNLLSPLALGDRCKHAVLLIKSDQKVHYRDNYLRLREHFRVPSIVFHGNEAIGKIDGKPWRGAVVRGAPVVRLLSYSILCRPEHSEVLEQIDADTVLGDEIHKISDRESRATARWLRFMVKRRGRVPFGGGSASAIRKKLDDIAHLALFSLGGGSPYPLDHGEVERWGGVVDPSREPDLHSKTYHDLRAAFGGGAPDVEDAISTLFGGSVQAIREGILDRVIHTPGIVATRVSETTASITLSEFKVRAIPQHIQKRLADVRQRWVRPDGEELAEAVEVVACAKNIGSGFHYYWHFFDDPPVELIEAWREARKAWCKEVRGKIQEDIPHLDSPKLCENAAKRAYQNPTYEGPLPVWRSKCWLAWAEVKDQIRYEQRTNWLDDFFANDLVEWGQKHRGIIWYDSTALGERVAKLGGFRLHGGGPNAEARILAERGDTILASINAHREGRDGLQHYYHRGVVCEPMSSGDGWHQLLGRYCRPGQIEDEIEMAVPLHVAEFREAMRSAYRYAAFDRDMSPNEQLLLAADADEAVLSCR